jgi:hypothetical protein
MASGVDVCRDPNLSEAIALADKRSNNAEARFKGSALHSKLLRNDRDAVETRADLGFSITAAATIVGLWKLGAAATTMAGMAGGGVLAAGGAACAGGVCQIGAGAAVAAAGSGTAIGGGSLVALGLGGLATVSAAMTKGWDSAWQKGFAQSREQFAAMEKLSTECRKKKSCVPGSSEYLDFQRKWQGAYVNWLEKTGDQTKADTKQNLHNVGMWGKVVFEGVKRDYHKVDGVKLWSEEDATRSLKQNYPLQNRTLTPSILNQNMKSYAKLFDDLRIKGEREATGRLKHESSIREQVDPETGEFKNGNIASFGYDKTQYLAFKLGESRYQEKVDYTEAVLMAQLRDEYSNMCAIAEGRKPNLTATEWKALETVSKKPEFKDYMKDPKIVEESEFPKEYMKH